MNKEIILVYPSLFQALGSWEQKKESEKKMRDELCGLHEVYSHIMASSNLFICLSTRVERLSRDLVSLPFWL